MINFLSQSLIILWVIVTKISEISEKSVLNFHLSHVTSENFNYTTNEKTSKIYLEVSFIK